MGCRFSLAKETPGSLCSQQDPEAENVSAPRNSNAPSGVSRKPEKFPQCAARTEESAISKSNARITGIPNWISLHDPDGSQLEITEYEVEDNTAPASRFVMSSEVESYISIFYNTVSAKRFDYASLPFRSGLQPSPYVTATPSHYQFFNLARMTERKLLHFKQLRIERRSAGISRYS